jgi:tRNA pseudouridine65 synthase
MADAGAPLAVLYRDAQLVAIDKPSGWLVHRSDIDRHETRVVVQVLRDQLGCHVHPVHRLDKGTSGVLLLALDADSHRQVSQQWHEAAKTYLAVVRGWPDDEGLIDHPLAVLDEDGSATAAERQPAQTHYRCLARAELPHAVDRYPTARYALCALDPLSGRRHQIRRHLKHIAHPIVGDATYGKGRHNRLFQALFGCQRLLLACSELKLRHPATGQPLSIRAGLDDCFANTLRGLGWPAAIAQAGFSTIR